MIHLTNLTSLVTTYKIIKPLNLKELHWLSRITKIDFYLFLGFRNYSSNLHIYKSSRKKCNNSRTNLFLKKKEKICFIDNYIRNVIKQFKISSAYDEPVKLSERQPGIRKTRPLLANLFSVNFCLCQITNVQNELYSQLHWFFDNCYSYFDIKKS